MPYAFTDLSGNGRDLVVTNMAQVQWPPTGALANTQGTISHTTQTPTAPGISYADAAGFFAPVYGAADEAISFVFAAVIAAGTTAHRFLAWGRPSVPGDGYLIGMDSTEQFECQLRQAGGGAAYLGSFTSPVSTGSHLFHAEIRTGATREVNLWLDAVLVSQTRSGPTGTPHAVVGDELLYLNCRAGAAGALQEGNTVHPLGVAGFRRGRFTDAERLAHLRALNSAA